MNWSKHVVSFVVMYILIFCINFVYAQESYRTEISANYSNLREQDNDETNIYSASADLYFAPVNTSNHPLAESAFLERIGSFSLFGGHGEGEGSSFDSKGPFYGVSLTVRKPQLPFTFRALYRKTEVDFDIQEDENQERDTDSYFLGIGYFIKPAFWGEFQYSHSKSETTFSGSSLETSSKSHFYGVSAKFVKELPDSTAYNITGTAGVLRFDKDGDKGSNIIVTVSGDYYFNRQISVGADYVLNTGDDKDAEGNTISIGFNAFFNQQISVNAGIAKFFAKNPEGEDDESFNAGITIRL